MIAEKRSTSEKKRLVGVVLLGFGGPTSYKEVEPFLKRMLGPQDLSPQIVAKTLKKYKSIGERSPYLEITKRQAELLEKLLNQEKGAAFKVYVGMSNWHPLIEETVGEILRDGPKRIVALSLSPYYSKATTGSYFKKLGEALAKAKSSLEVLYVRSWYNEPLYLKALAKKIKESFNKTSLKGKDKPQIIFSAHSLSKSLTDEGDPYLEQLEETIKGVLELIGDISWHLAFQSAGERGEWLKPEVEFVLEDLATRNCKEVLLVPLSFISDQVEILYDIDVIYHGKAEELGLTFFRTNSLNDSPLLIKAMAESVKKHLR